MVGQVEVESALTQYLRFTLTYTEDEYVGCEDLLVRLVAPDGSVIHNGSAAYDRNLAVRTISIDASGYQVSERCVPYHTTVKIL